MFQPVLDLSENQVSFLYSQRPYIFPITFLKVNYSHWDNIMVENFAKSICLINLHYRRVSLRQRRFVKDKPEEIAFEVGHREWDGL